MVSKNKRIENRECINENKQRNSETNLEIIEFQARITEKIQRHNRMTVNIR